MSDTSTETPANRSCTLPKFCHGKAAKRHGRLTGASSRVGAQSDPTLSCRHSEVQKKLNRKTSDWNVERREATRAAVSSERRHSGSETTSERLREQNKWPQTANTPHDKNKKNRGLGNEKGDVSDEELSSFLPLLHSLYSGSSSL